MSIFPFLDPQGIPIEEEREIPYPKEYAWDFDTLDFKTKNGKFYLVEGKEAIKIWLWKLFKTPGGRYAIFSNGYGHELENLIGVGFTRGLVQSEAERYIREAIEHSLSVYVTDITNLEIDLVESLLTISFTAITIYGEVEFNA